MTVVAVVVQAIPGGFLSVEQAGGRHRHLLLRTTLIEWWRWICWMALQLSVSKGFVYAAVMGAYVRKPVSYCSAVQPWI